MGTAHQWLWLLQGASNGSTAVTERHLGDIVALLAKTVPGVAACSITELDGGTYRTSVASSSDALDLDLAQYASGDGPCMTAARDRQTQHVRDTASSAQFAGFVAAARARAVRSSLSVPIRTAYHPAALNIYSADVDGFDESGRAVADLIGRALTERLTGSDRSTMSPTERTRVASQRRLILAAQEAVRAPGDSAGQAFEELARRSSRQGRSVFAVAADILDNRQELM